MQTLYPLGAVIALCYRVWGSVPWYGLFLCLCQFGCFWLAAVRLCALTEQAGGRAAADGAGARRGFSIGKKLLLLLVWSLFIWGVCLAHVVNIQYTVTSAMLSATALFLFDRAGYGQCAAVPVPKHTVHCVGDPGLSAAVGDASFDVPFYLPCRPVPPDRRKKDL